MFKEFSENEKDDDYLSEFKQKIANQQHEDMEERRQDLQRSRNGFIGTLAGIVLAGIVSWVLLAPRFSAQDAQDIPVVRRPISPAKIQPSEPGGMEILNQDKSVYDLVEKKETQEEKIESILPEPETPKMPVIAPQTESAAVDADKQDTTAENTVEDPLPVKVIEEDLEPVSVSSGEKIAIPEKLPEIELEAKTENNKAVETTVKTKQPAVTKTASVKKEPVTAKENKAPTTQTAAVKTNESPAVKTTEKTTVIAKGVWQVQLIASSNQKAVENAWKDLSTTHSVLKSLPHEIESTATDTGNTLYRLKAGAFADRTQADKVCAEVKKAGGSCIVKQK